MHLFLGLGPPNEEQEFSPLSRHYFHGTFHVFVATSIIPHRATDTSIPTRAMYKSTDTGGCKLILTHFILFVQALSLSLSFCLRLCLCLCHCHCLYRCRVVYYLCVVTIKQLVCQLPIVSEPISNQSVLVPQIHSLTLHHTTRHAHIHTCRYRWCVSVHFLIHIIWSYSFHDYRMKRCSDCYHALYVVIIAIPIVITVTFATGFAAAAVHIGRFADWLVGTAVAALTRRIVVIWWSRELPESYYLQTYAHSVITFPSADRMIRNWTIYAELFLHFYLSHSLPVFVFTPQSRNTLLFMLTFHLHLISQKKKQIHANVSPLRELSWMWGCNQTIRYVLIRFIYLFILLAVP